MIHVPETIDALREAVATSSGPLPVLGAGTKRRIDGDGPRLALASLRGITAYDPAECVVTALAGTPVAEMAATLAAHGQYLPFDPPLGDAGATIGGVVASGWSGPGRYRYGGVRDFVIGARVVDGEGRLVASGGQVVKNAAGFLLHHALVGSAGRLAVIAEVSLKVFPAPEARLSIAAAAPSLDEAIAAHERVRLANLDVDALDLDAATATVWVRLAGAADALPARVETARRHLALPAEVHTGGASSVWNTTPDPAREAFVKVPAAPSRLGRVFDALAPFGTCRASAGAAAVCLTTTAPLDEVSAALGAHGWRGVVVCGRDTGRLLGAEGRDAFHQRVRTTLDPHGRFC